MMRTVQLIGAFMRASLQQELAYRENFAISLAHSLLNLVTGVGGVWVLFNQVESIKGWHFPAALALLGIYLVLSALRGLVFGPSLDALIGMDGDVWTGRLDYTLLRPMDLQVIASLRSWRFMSLFDLLLGIGVILAAAAQPGAGFQAVNFPGFLMALAAAVVILYSILLAFSALVFFSPGMMFTWIFDAIFQVARYPVGIYPGALKLILTWVVPVGLMTTLPVQALQGELTPTGLAGSAAFAAAVFLGASWLFHRAARRYVSASS